MEKQRILILNKEQIERKLQRMAYEIWEHNSNETDITLIGIENGGLAVANNLASRLQAISPLKVHIIPLKLNKKQPLADDIQFTENLEGRSVILVDDVANSGKTLLYGLRPLLSWPLKKIMIAVLVDRKHKSYPVSSDIVGHSVATTLQDHIEVEVNGDEIVAAFLA